MTSVRGPGAGWYIVLHRPGDESIKPSAAVGPFHKPDPAGAFAAEVHTRRDGTASVLQFDERSASVHLGDTPIFPATCTGLESALKSVS